MGRSFIESRCLFERADCSSALGAVMKRYLGDSVYVEINDYGQIVLTTENGDRPTNTILLEPEVFSELTQYVCTTNRLRKSLLDK